MYLLQLYYFRTIALLESYSHAAEQLITSQSNLSHAISELEKELKASLFYRKGRNICLTSEGRDFLTYVDKALNEIDNGKVAMNIAADPLLGSVALSFNSYLSPSFIPTMVAKFHSEERFKNIKFSFQEVPTSESVELIRKHTIDIGFGANLNYEDLQYCPICTEKLVVVVPNSERWNGKNTITPSELNGEDFIAYTPSCGIKSQVDKLLSNTKPHIVYEVPADALMVGMAASGLGIAIMPFTAELAYYNVIILEIKCEESIESKLCMFWRKEDDILSAAKSFRDFVRDSVNIS